MTVLRWLALSLFLSGGVALARGRGGFEAVTGEPKGSELTELPAPNFFSVPMTAPVRWAALRALLPRTTVSRAAPPRVLLPILVTESQSSDMMNSL